MMEKLTVVITALSMLVAYTLCHGNEGFRGPHHPRSSQQHQHYVPSSDSDKAAKLTHDKQLLHDKEHLKEDLGEWLFQDGKEMSPEEMEFHYFKTHDFDNNSKLDGLEILQAISHILPMTEVTGGAEGATSDGSHSHSASASHQTQLTEGQKEEMRKQREEDFNYYVDLIDKVLQEDDLDRDGYLSYVEYSIGRRREEEAAKAGVKSK